MTFSANSQGVFSPGHKEDDLVFGLKTVSLCRSLLFSIFSCVFF
jgi:hypothetical protein